MTSLGDLLPMLGLRIRAGSLELRGITDDDLPALCDLAAGGIHPPDRMPFFVPWTDASPEELLRNTAQYHWRSRAEFSPAAWSLHLGVWRDGVLVGTQALETKDFLVTRTGETGSWLGSPFQGQGIGTAMRQAIGAFAHNLGLVLTPQTFVRGAHELHVEGLAAFRRSVGLEDPQRS